jgi:predicted MFS family arabinose efflux permease
LAQALGSIPAALLAEKIGHRRAFLIAYGIAGISHFFRIWNGSIALTLVASFFSGLALAGDFVVGLPFIAANSSEKERTYAFSTSTLLNNLCYSLGALLGGFGPTLLRSPTLSLTTRYRLTLGFASALILLAVVPMYMIRGEQPRSRERISLWPYLGGMDSFTRTVALIELFLGLAIGLIIPFMNVFFVYRLGATRELFGTVSAISLLPSLIGTALGPALARKMGTIRSIASMRVLVALSIVFMGVATSSLLGAPALWSYQVLFMLSQPIWFAYAMANASPRAKAPVAAWINLTYWLGNALAAPVTGRLFARSHYAVPFYLAAVSALFAAYLTFIVGRQPPQPAGKENPISAH